MLLGASQVLLSRMDSGGVDADDAVVIDPIDFDEDVIIEASIVSPYMSVDDGTMIPGLIVWDSIVGQDASLEWFNIADSLVDNRTGVSGDPTRLNVGDNSQIEL